MELIENPNILVLLATYNGERFLNQLILSLKSQVKVNVKIMAVDNGSQDSTVKILESHGIEVLPHQARGAKETFFKALQVAGESDFYAFADQDDIWYENKLHSAIDQISGTSGPCLYVGSVVRSDSGRSVLPREQSLFDVIFRNFSQGCTMVFNKELKRQIVPSHNEGIIMHDWWTRLLAQSIGTVVIDTRPTMIYRIHENNDTGIPGSKTRLIRIYRRLKSRTLAINQIQQLYRLNLHLEEKGFKTKQIQVLCDYFSTNKSLLKKTLYARKRLKLNLRKTIYLIILFIFSKSL